MTEPRPDVTGGSLQKLDLSDKDWDRYVSRVRDTQAPHELRQGPRHRKIVQCVLRIEQGRDAQVYVIHSRDIGNGGMSFMHSTALPESADCTVVLETNGGEGYVLRGCVRWCREVGGGLHAVGVVFDQQLDLSAFVDVSEPDVFLATDGAYAA